MMRTYNQHKRPIQTTFYSHTRSTRATWRWKTCKRQQRRGRARARWCLADGHRVGVKSRAGTGPISTVMPSLIRRGYPNSEQQISRGGGPTGMKQRTRTVGIKWVWMLTVHQ